MILPLRPWQSKACFGDPYSVHPIEVANILTDLKLDSATITTGLLHDTIEDTFATYETIKGEFEPKLQILLMVLLRFLFRKYSLIKLKGRKFSKTNLQPQKI